LRVHVSDEPGDDALRDGSCILEADIGPPFDGSMSMTQFCTNFGVTINGAIPDETDTDAHRYADLTGQMTFWKAHLNRVTIETSRKIVGIAWSAFPDALLVKPITNDQFKLERLALTNPTRIDTTNIWLIDGPSRLSEINTNPEDYILPKLDQLQISISFSSWKYPAPKYTSQLGLAEEELGRTFFVPGERNMPKEIELTYDSLSFSASFRKEDQYARGALESLGEAISQQLPVTSLERVDLVTGKTLGQIDRPIDPVVVEWCSTSADRWLSIMRDTRNGPWIGVRPVRARTWHSPRVA
jgi:hypothetical protein